MIPSFLGLNTALRGLLAQQAGIDTVSHNIDNANTPGYSRQQVNLSTTSPYPLFQAGRIGPLGTGVDLTQITRVRNDFLDGQYWQQNQYLGYWDEKQTNMTRVTAIINEPSDTGLSTVASNFWDAWEKLSTDSDNLSARMQVKQSALALTQTLNQTASQLSDLSSNLQTSIQTDVTQVNSYLQQIASLNKQISAAEQIGNAPNDLLDQRVYLMDQLSKLANVQASEQNGAFQVTIGGQTVLSDQTVTPLTADLSQTDPANILSVPVGGGEIKGMLDSLSDVQNVHSELDAYANSISSGPMTISLAGAWTLMGAAGGATPSFPVDTKLADGRSYKAGDAVPTDLLGTSLSDGTKVATIPQGATVTVNGLNGLHRIGYSLNDQGGDFFSSSVAGQPISAATITLNPSIVNDVSNIAAALTTQPTSGSGSHPSIPGDGALAMSINAIKGAQIDFTASGVPTALSKGTLDSYLQAIVGQLGVKGQEANRQVQNQQVLVQQVDGQRQSVSGVSLDEEMTHMIQYQQAYSASARMITTINDMLTTLINKTGVS